MCVCTNVFMCVWLVDLYDQICLANAGLFSLAPNITPQPHAQTHTAHTHTHTNSKVKSAV